MPRAIIDFSRVPQDTLFASPLDLEGEKLVQRQLHVFQRDFDWRQKWTDFQTCTDLYEATTGDSSEQGIPRRNLIRRAVNDHHAVALQNIPTVKLQANPSRNFMHDVFRQSLISEVHRITEESLNIYTRSVLDGTDVTHQRHRALKHTSIYGVGYLLVEVNENIDTRKSAELRALLNKPLVDITDEFGNVIKEGWTEQDAALYKVLSKMITVRHIDSKDVYFQEGITQPDDRMLRVHYVERFSTAQLRRVWNNDKILPTTTIPTQAMKFEEDNVHNITAVLTTYEQVPYEYSKAVTDEQGNELFKVTVTDWFLVKSVIAGGQLLEKKVFTSIEESEIGEHGSTMMPIVAYYLTESEEHPYGYALPLQLALSEEFINRMYFIMYKSARKAVSNQGVIINAQALGKGDIERINMVLDEGGVVPLYGDADQQGRMDIRQMVQPLNYTQSQLPAAIIDVTRSEEQSFTDQSNAIDTAALNRARSGAGKRAQIAANDRPKTSSITLLARSEEQLYNTVFDNIRLHHNEFVAIPVEVPGQGMQIITLNEPFERMLPVFDEFGQLVRDPEFAEPGNEAGIVLEPFRVVVNSVATSMKATADIRTELPNDMISRFQILAAMQQLNTISPRTTRDLTLNEHIRAIDDINRKKDQEEAEAQQAALLQQQLAAQQQGLEVPSLDQAGALSPLVQDASDQEQVARNEINAESQDLIGFRSA